MGKRELIEITESIRIENGPIMKNAIATEELLSDMNTAGRYHVGVKDSLGNEIVLGKEMYYLDDKGDWGWYVYQLKDVGLNESGKVIGIDINGKYVKSSAASYQKRFVVVDIKSTKELAIQFAEKLKE
jgi:hypothetical protein